MSFEANKLPEFDHKISDLPDQPNMQPNELKAYFDANPELLRQALGALCDALSDESAAGSLGFSPTAGIPVTTLQAALEHLHGLLADAVVGKLPTGSVTQDKLAQDVRDRFTAIERAAAAEASARASADSNLQSQIDTHTTQIAAKCELYFGSYSGDGGESKYISLGFAPKAVICSDASGGITDLGRTTGAIAFPGVSSGGLQIEGNGFRVYQDDDYHWNNLENRGPFHFIAIK